MVSGLKKFFSFFVTPQVSSPRLQQLATGPCLEHTDHFTSLVYFFKVNINVILKFTLRSLN
jgi:hypothetical protein